MIESTKNLCGSPSRDVFKFLHKHLCPPGWWGLDGDFILIDKNGIIAKLEFKNSGEKLTWAEIVAYNDELKHGFLVFIVRARIPYDFMMKIKDLSRRLDPAMLDEAEAYWRKMEIFRYEYCDPDEWKGVVIDDFEKVGDDFIEWEHKLRNG